MHNDWLNPEQRANSIRRLAREKLDILVVGGGVTGAGTALDAATRGLRVGLVEARDFASGTSSRSGKTFHGGLRYLEQLNVPLVRQALRERDHMLEFLCPHLARPQPFLIPFATRLRERGYIGAGVALYDSLSLGRRTLPYHRHLTRQGALRQMPALRSDALRGAVQYWDVRVDDARHTMTLARTAAGHGAITASRAEVSYLRREGPRVTGARVHDTETGTTFDVDATVVINASGAWSDDVAATATTPEFKVKPAKGVHLVVPRDRIDSRTGLTARTPDSVLVVRPWWNHWVLGTTDTPWHYDKSDPAATAVDVDYLLGQANRWLRRPLRRADVVGAYAGLRPLLAPADGAGSAATTALSRDHAVLRSTPGLITVTGGKYTTYRVMARDAVDAAVQSLPRTATASCTERIPLVGAEGWAGIRNERVRFAAESGFGLSRIDHLLDRYGARTPEVLDLADDPELGEPLPGAPGYLAAEVVHAARREGALHLADVLRRRTHAHMETPDRAVRAAGAATAILAEELGWSQRTAADELARWRHSVDADLRGEAAPDDESAHAVRAGSVMFAMTRSTDQFSGTSQELP